jgi:hypothetical protein
MRPATSHHARAWFAPTTSFAMTTLRGGIDACLAGVN